MRFLVHSKTRTGLTPEQTTRLYAAAQAFYTGMPPGVLLEADYILADRSGSYSVLTVPDRDTMDRIMAPFAGLVDAEVVLLLEAQTIG